MVDAFWVQGIAGATVTAPKVEVSSPNAYGGARKVREIENFSIDSNGISTLLTLWETILV